MSCHNQNILEPNSTITEELEIPLDILTFGNGSKVQIASYFNDQKFCLTSQKLTNTSVYNIFHENYTLESELIWLPCSSENLNSTNSINSPATKSNLVPIENQLFIYDSSKKWIKQNDKCMTPLPINNILHENLHPCDQNHFLSGAGTYLFLEECEEEEDKLNNC